MDSFYDRFELIEKIASGGMANIYRAWLHGTDGFRKNLAVKTISPSLLKEPEFVEMFKKEASLAALLDHPCVVKVYEFNQVVEGFHYIAMEYVDGVDLRELIKSDGIKLTPEQVFFIGKQILRALDYAWNFKDETGTQLELIHRDISPHNIMISKNGEVKLADFGIAKFRDAVSYTKSNMVRGKLHYLAPEQARGEILDARSDIFSLGLVLWEMLTGRKRYINRGQDIFTEIISGYYIPPSTVRTDLNSSVDALLHCFLAPDRDHRFSSAREAVAEIENLYNTDETASLGIFSSNLIEHRELNKVSEKMVEDFGMIYTASTDLTISQMEMSNSSEFYDATTTMISSDRDSKSVDGMTETITVIHQKKQGVNSRKTKLLIGAVSVLIIAMIAVGIKIYSDSDKQMIMTGFYSGDKFFTGNLKIIKEVDNSDENPEKKPREPEKTEKVKIIYIKPIAKESVKEKKPVIRKTIVMKAASARKVIIRGNLPIRKKETSKEKSKFTSTGLRKIEGWD
ncbi:MAG: protein kinase [Deltaproteobacteria bacterium]|nr:protein kinase [Deltaproteobacteria bacterium]